MQHFFIDMSEPTARNARVRKRLDEMRTAACSRRLEEY
jgi:hypothetical protein